MDERKLLEPQELYLEIDRFWGILKDAQKVLAADDTKGGREAAKTSLVGAIFFISRAYGHDLVEPLRRLLTALENLDDGKVDAIVEKAVFSHSPGNASSVYIFRALVAAVMEFNVHAGMAGQAAEAAARAANRSRADGQDRITAKQVARWRSDLRQAIGSTKRSRQDEDGVRQYLDTLAAYKQLYPQDPAAAAREIAELLPRFVPPPQITRNPSSSGE